MRFKKSIQPNEIKNVYAPNTYFTIKLPRGKLDLHSFTLYYDGLPANYAHTGTRTIRRFFPRLSSCIIDELTIKVNSKVVQYIREYNMLKATLNDVNKEYDDLDSTAFDTIQGHKFDANGVIQQNLKIQSVAGNLGKYVDDNKESFFISEWLGFLQEGNSQYFDTTNMDVEIMIRTAPANILYRGVNITPVIVTTQTFEPDYKLSNIYATIDVLDDIPEMPSKYEFLDYQYTQGVYSDDDKNSLTSFQIDKPVRWVLGTFASELRLVDNGLQLSHTNSDENSFGKQLLADISIDNYNELVPKGLLYSYEMAKLQKKPYTLNSSVYFTKYGLGITHTKFRMNTFDLTPRMDILSCYNETKKCFNSKYKKVISLQAFESDFFVNAIRVDANDEDLKHFEWEVHSRPNEELGGQPMLFCCFVNKL